MKDVSIDTGDSGADKQAKEQFSLRAFSEALYGEWLASIDDDVERLGVTRANVRKQGKSLTFVNHVVVVPGVYEGVF